MPSNAAIKRTEEAIRAEGDYIGNHPDVVAAKRALQHAEEEAAHLDVRALTRDEGVTADDTARARETVRLARLAVNEAVTAAEQQYRQERAQQLAEATEQARTVLGQHGQDRIAELQAKATQALTELLQAIDEQHAIHWATTTTLRRLGAPQWDNDRSIRMGDVQSGAVPVAVTSISGGGAIWIDGQRYNVSDRERTAGRAVAQANRATGNKLVFASGLSRYLH